MKILQFFAIGSVLLMLAGCPAPEETEDQDREREKDKKEKKEEQKEKALEGDFEDQPFSLPALPYKAGALEPDIDWKTMTIHHQRHHRGYVSTLNNAVDGTDAAEMSLRELMQNIGDFSTTIRNSGGGHYNHSLFWKVMSPDGGGDPEGEVREAIENGFGSIGDFRKTFNEAAGSLFGSGWAWLSVDEDGELFVSTTPNQDNPLMDVVDAQGKPILGLDLWEHAYYLNYQNQRGEYIESFWNVVNWEEVERRYKKATEDKDEA